jgi:hypothetical protein
MTIPDQSLVSARDGLKVAIPSPLAALRPMEIGEILDEAFDLYRRNFRLLFGAAILVYLPIAPLFILAGNDMVWSLVNNILSFILGMWTVGALTYAASDRLEGRPITIAQAYRRGLGRLFRLCSASIIGGLAVFGGLLLFVIPGLIVWLLFVLLSPRCVLENRGGVGALRRAWRLSSGELWRLFFLILGLFVASMLFAAVLMGLGALLALFLGYQQATGGSTAPTGPMATAVMAVIYLASSLAQGAWTPFWTNTQLLAYRDLRIRKEAYDLEALTSAVEARVAAGRAEAMAPPSGPIELPAPETGDRWQPE